MSQPVPLVRLDHISKAFPGVRALDDVSFDVLPGEVHVLMGENGAGKSTLMKILSGAYQPDSGAIQIDGYAVRLSDPLDANRRGIVMIYQELTLLDNLDVGRNVMLGQEPGRGGGVDWRALYADAERILRDLDLTLDVRAPVAELNMAERQMVEIARAARRDPRVIVMDEPTSSLTQSEEETLFALIARLKGRGVGIIYISHRMDEVFRLADRITVLRDGKHVTTLPASELTRAELIALMVGREVESSVPRGVGAIGQIVLAARGLSAGGRVRDVDLDLRAGEIVGLAGLIGAGRTEVAEVLFGARSTDMGELRIDGQPVVFQSPYDAIQRGIAYVPDDRKGQGLVLMQSVQTNVTLAALERFVRTPLLMGGVLNGRAIRELVEVWTARLNIRAASPKVNVELLSGGNQQKVVLAKWLSRNPRVLILNEPTRGIDVGAKAEVHALIRDIASQGVAVLMISSELPEVLSVSDRIVVMAAGRITGEMPARGATERAVLALAFGDTNMTERVS
ncbi:MAG: sugar ABC transporter ATP-binding protein [Chloroflexota bacterium]|nr:sugar ABC transporter ATP-binding protein [Chloroflexota bacterium]